MKAIGGATWLFLPPEHPHFLDQRFSVQWCGRPGCGPVASRGYCEAGGEWGQGDGRAAHVAWASAWLTEAVPVLV